jgi:hypothetical protein
MFCHLFSWSKLDFSAITVSVSAVSLRRLTTYILLDFKVAKWAVSYLTHCSNPFQENIYISRFMIQILHNIQNYRKRKDIREKRYQNCKLPNLCGNQLISTYKSPT